MRRPPAGCAIALVLLLVLPLGAPLVTPEPAAGATETPAAAGPARAPEPAHAPDSAPLAARGDAGRDPGWGGVGHGRWTGVGPGTAGNDDPPVGERGPADGPAAATRHRVTLVTGETVTIARRDGEVAVEAVEGGSVERLEAGGRTYLLPTDVDLGTYDRSLFAVDALLADRARGQRVLLDATASPAAVRAAGRRAVRALRSAGVVAAETDPAAPRAMESLVEAGHVERVTADARVGRPPVPTSAALAPRRATGGPTGAGVTVAVLDTGIDATHPALDDRVVGRMDLVADASGGSPDGPLDPHGHGTHVAGVVAGTGEAADGRAYAGVAPGASLLDVRVMDERGTGRASTIIRGIERAVGAGADVLLLSIGTGLDDSEEIAESVAWAADRGTVVVAAAGNNGRPRSIGAPGRPAGAITVGGVEAGRVADYSSRGPTLEGGLKPDLVAPSGGIVGPLAAGSGRLPVEGADRYTRIGGTSVAAPQVAGAAALLLERDPALSARAVENRLASAARPVAGADVYAHGGGLLDVGRALDPDIVASDAVVDFGLVETGGTRTQPVEFVNRDDVRHDLDLETAVRNVDRGRPADATAWLNRSRLSLAPGERAVVGLAIDANATAGAHAGEIRYAVDGEPRTVAFGFVRGGTVTVEKRPLTPGDPVDGDELWVLTEEATHDELLAFENGSASFVAGGGTYVLWSTGYDAPTGTTVFLSERVRVSEPSRVVLDESRTVPLGVDVSALADRYGRLHTRSLVVSMSTRYAGGLVKRSVSRRNPEGRAVRVSPDPKLDAATTVLLSTGPARADDLDAADVFTLGHGVRGLSGPAVREVAPEDLATSEHRYHRRTVDETYRLRDRTALDAVWNQRSSRWFDLRDRRVQRVHRLPGVATYERNIAGEDWQAYRETRGREDPTPAVLAHPMLAHLDVTSATGGVAVTARPFDDGAGTAYDPSGTQVLEARVDGEVVATADAVAGRASLGPLPIDPGAALTVRLEGADADGRLSTRTLTELELPAYAPPGSRRIAVPDRPPTVTDLSVGGASLENAVGADPVRLSVEVDLVGTPVDPVVWYATGAPAAPPWEDPTGWRRADADWTGDRLTAALPVERTNGTLSVAARVADIWGRRTRTMTLDAVHLGAAPNASTATIGGRLRAADGAPAAGDTVVLRRPSGGRQRHVRTDDRGRFAVEVPIDRAYHLVYLRGPRGGPRPRVTDDRPAWYPLGRVDADAESIDLGARTLPAAHRLNVTVTDERGEPVAGATVAIEQGRDDGTIRDRLVTGDRGHAVGPAGPPPGIALAGRVGVTVSPPANPVYPAQTHRRTVVLDRPRQLTVTLETAPPEAMLTAFGRFEPGRVVFLNARRSEVPAGPVAYRWDVDGDGVVDRVTEDPVVRVRYAAGDHRATVTVVDRAGKTDTAGLTVRVRGE